MSQASRRAARSCGGKAFLTEKTSRNQGLSKFILDSNQPNQWHDYYPYHLEENDELAKEPVSQEWETQLKIDSKVSHYKDLQDIADREIIFSSKQQRNNQYFFSSHDKRRGRKRKSPWKWDYKTGEYKLNTSLYCSNPPHNGELGRKPRYKDHRQMASAGKVGKVAAMIRNHHPHKYSF